MGICCGKPTENLDTSAKEEKAADKADEENTLNHVRCFSKSKSPAYAWLCELGLERYAPAFVNAGWDDWGLLALLDENDLALIEMHNNLVILPGHKKKLLLAAKQMCCQDPSAAKQKKKMKRRKSGSFHKRISPIQPMLQDLASTQLSASAQNRAKAQLEAQNAEMLRRVSSPDFDKFSLPPHPGQQQGQQQQQPHSPQQPSVAFQSTPHPVAQAHGTRDSPDGVRCTSRTGSRDNNSRDNSSGSSSSSSRSSKDSSSGSASSGMETVSSDSGSSAPAGASHTGAADASGSGMGRSHEKVKQQAKPEELPQDSGKTGMAGSVMFRQEKDRLKGVGQAPGSVQPSRMDAPLKKRMPAPETSAALQQQQQQQRLQQQQQQQQQQRLQQQQQQKQQQQKQQQQRLQQEQQQLQQQQQREQRQRQQIPQSGVHPMESSCQDSQPEQPQQLTLQERLNARRMERQAKQSSSKRGGDEGSPPLPPAVPFPDIPPMMETSARRHVPLSPIPSNPNSLRVRHGTASDPSSQRASDTNTTTHPSGATRQPLSKSASKEQLPGTQQAGRASAEPSPAASPSPSPGTPPQAWPAPGASGAGTSPGPSPSPPKGKQGRKVWGAPTKEPKEPAANGGPTPERASASTVAAANGAAAAGVGLAGPPSRPWSCPSGNQQARLQQQEREQALGKPPRHASPNHGPSEVSQSIPSPDPQLAAGLRRPGSRASSANSVNSRASASARANKTLAVPTKPPDASSSPWNQDEALCIAGVGYQPALQLDSVQGSVAPRKSLMHQKMRSRSPSPGSLPPLKLPHVDPAERERSSLPGMQLSENPAFSPQGTTSSTRQHNRQNNESSSLGALLSDDNDEDQNTTLDYSALMKVIGPDTIRTPPPKAGSNSKHSSSAMSVTLRAGLGPCHHHSPKATLPPEQRQQQQQKQEPLQVAQKLEAILHGLERKGFGHGQGGKGKHTARQAELQELHAEVEERLRRTLHPSLMQGAALPADSEHAADPELRDIESRIAAKLQELEGQLAS